MTAFGVNAIVIPPSFETGRHYHEEQEELYFVHRGRLEFEFGDGSKHELGKDGYVGRDGVLPEGESRTGSGGPAEA